jgi:surface-anchored protein
VFLPLSDKPYVAGDPANSGARFTQPGSTAFAFTGVPAGQPLWVAVQGTPGIGEAWPGLENNQDAGTFGSYIPDDPRVSQTNARPWIRISLDGYTPPPGASSHFSLWTTSSGFPPTVWMSTFEDTTVNDFYYAEGTHNHMNWGFSAPGIHRVRLKASAFAGPGETNPTGFSAVHTVTFAIGPFAQWQASHFGDAELDEPLVSGPEADPDGDGMSNLVEFGFGFDPRSGAATPVSQGLGLPEMSLVEESGMFYQVLEYPARRAGLQFSPLSYVPEFSDGTDWHSDGVTTTVGDFPPESGALNAVWEKVTSRRPTGAAVPARGFGRVGVVSGN